MGHHDHGQSLSGQRPHNAQHFPYHLGIQRGGGLVKKQDFRIHGQRSCNGYPLLLSAGDLSGLCIDIGGHIHLFQELKRPFLCFFLGLFGHLDLTYHAVFQYRQIVKQIKVLEYHAHLFPVSRYIYLGIRNILSVIQNTAAGRDL